MQCVDPIISIVSFLLLLSVQFCYCRSNNVESAGLVILSKERSFLQRHKQLKAILILLGICGPIAILCLWAIRLGAWVAHGTFCSQNVRKLAV
jgi:hypothetical protein